ncbi:hypothetical protein [uncultured Formosa sp.]|uniref:hypothetical protein n=1 Tax=uncultured Formosa sp. TaxID=255435 RepID=UPI002631D700|nr:hypothetical protein [uncultured Formosa sp.]
MKIITSFITTLLMVLILFNSTRVSFTYAYYNMDRVGFIDAFCINKDKPELQCNGKCHLKKVAETQDPKENTPESIIDFKVLLLFSNPIQNYTLTHLNIVNKQNAIVYKNLYTFKPISACFHPPRV